MCIKCAVKCVVKYVLTFHALTLDRCVMRAVVNVISSLTDPSAAAAAKEEEAMGDDGVP